MCEFVSWKEMPPTWKPAVERRIYFLTGADLTSKRGRELKKHLGSNFNEDKVGHGAIDWFYQLEGVGRNKEKSDFSSPQDFPTEIIEALKTGEFHGMGIAEEMLTPRARADYKAKWAPLNADYRAKRDILNADYEAKLAPLNADYEAKRDILYADYEAKLAPLNADYKAKRDILNADYEAKLAPLNADYKAKRDILNADYRAKWDILNADYKAKWAPLNADYRAKWDILYADYEAKRAPLNADYEAKRAPLNADYEAKRDILFWGIAQDSKNRRQVWR